MKDSEAQLNKLIDEVKLCKKCELSKTRIKTVFSDGCEYAPVMFIGEAPGKNEDEVGIPFIGRAGQLLRKYLFEVGYKQEDFYIANTVKCRPPENRKPTPKEKEECYPYLEKQIELVDPEIIVLVGSTAMESFIKEKTTITKARGKIFEANVAGKIRKFFPVFHPSYLLRYHSEENGTPRYLFREDLNTVRNLISR